MVSLSAKIVVICFLVNIAWTAKTGHYEQDPQVSHFFGITKTVLDNDNESRRRERLLGQQIGTSIAELVEIIVKSFESLAEMMPLQRITNIDFEANPQLVKTVSTVLSGFLLAVFWPSSAMFGTMVYYVLAASSSLVTIIHRLYSDHDYLVNAAGRLGLEAGQGLLEGDIVENLSSGLETARGAYNFLADLS